jgi:thiamine-phosphate diphosphorylase
VRRGFGNDLTIGVSVHSAPAAAQALNAGADYVFLGPIWQTISHPERAPLGIEAITDVGKGKVIAIGGITVERTKGCLDAGAYGIAAISAVWDAPDPVSVISRMCDIFDAQSA